MTTTKTPLPPEYVNATEDGQITHENTLWVCAFGNLTKEITAKLAHFIFTQHNQSFVTNILIAVSARDEDCFSGGFFAPVACFHGEGD
jgi:hypothetical protein